MAEDLRLRADEPAVLAGEFRAEHSVRCGAASNFNGIQEKVRLPLGEAVERSETDEGKASGSYPVYSR